MNEVMRGARLCCVLLRVMAVLLCGQGSTCSCALCPCMLRGVAAGGVEAFTALSLVAPFTRLLPMQQQYFFRLRIMFALQDRCAARHVDCGKLRGVCVLLPAWQCGQRCCS